MPYRLARPGYIITIDVLSDTEYLLTLRIFIVFAGVLDMQRSHTVLIDAYGQDVITSISEYDKGHVVLTVQAAGKNTVRRHTKLEALDIAKRWYFTGLITGREFGRISNLLNA